MSTVEEYANDIDRAAFRLVLDKDSKVDWEFYAAKMGIAFSTGYLTYTLLFKDLLYHASGAVTAGVSKLLEKYAKKKGFEKASEKISQLELDKRFKEYGLDKAFDWEIRSFRRSMTKKTDSHMHPSDYALNTIQLAIDIAVPPVAFAWLINNYQEYLEMFRISKEIGKAMELGDQVKEKLQAGVSEKEIREWLGQKNIMQS